MASEFKLSYTASEINEKLGRIPDEAIATESALTLKADQTTLKEVSILVGDTAVSEQITEAISQIPQSDWNENDESNPSFIKNRPFGEKENKIDITGLECEISNMTQSACQEIVAPLQLGQIWNVFYNSLTGVIETLRHENLEVQIGEDGTCYLGDLNKANIPFYIKNNEIYFNSSFINQLQPTIFKIVGVSGTYTDKPIVHHLDPKYIKDMYYEYEEPITESREFSAQSSEGAELVDAEFARLLYDNWENAIFTIGDESTANVGGYVEINDCTNASSYNDLTLTVNTVTNDGSDYTTLHVHIGLDSGTITWGDHGMGHMSNGTITVTSKKMVKTLDPKYLPDNLQNCYTIKVIDHELTPEEFIALPEGYYDFFNYPLTIEGTDGVAARQVMGLVCLVPVEENVKGVFDYFTGYFYETGLIEEKLVYYADSLYPMSEALAAFMELEDYLFGSVIGNEEMSTEDKTLTGAINEINSKLGSHTHSWNDLEDRPFYHEEDEILFDEDVTLKEAGASGECQYFFESKLPLVVGESYTFTYDNGATYTFVMSETMTEFNGDTGYVCVSDTLVAIQYPSTFNGRLTIAACEKHVQLDEKYIPNTIARVEELPTKLSELENDLETVQADWNQNDSTQPDYVENRTHWRSDLTDSTVAEGTDVTFEYYEGAGGYYIHNDAFLEDGVEYTLTWDGETNVYTAKTYNSGDTSEALTRAVKVKFAYIGNLSLYEYDAGLEDTGENFLLYSNYDSNYIDIITNDTSETTHTYKLTKKGYEYYPLDRKYLPEDAILPEIENASGNEIIKYDASLQKWVLAQETCQSGTGYMSGHIGFANGVSGSYSLAVGQYNNISNFSSTAFGNGLIARGKMQHVQGKYNIEDTTNTYAHIVGNGTFDTARSNAHTLDWDGNAWYQGTVESNALILSSPNGTRFKITVGDDGTLSASEITA